MRAALLPTMCRARILPYLLMKLFVHHWETPDLHAHTHACPANACMECMRCKPLQAQSQTSAFVPSVPHANVHARTCMHAPATATNKPAGPCGLASSCIPTRMPGARHSRHSPPLGRCQPPLLLVLHPLLLQTHPLRPTCCCWACCWTCCCWACCTSCRGSSSLARPSRNPCHEDTLRRWG